MLKRLFTSSTRIKLLTIFLLNPDEEFFIRELTRKLDEQINSIRRELDNLKKMGLLKSKELNRKKYYMVNKNFVAYHELKGIILKCAEDKDNIVKKLMQLGTLDVIVLSGFFVEMEDSAVDLLLVGSIDRQQLQHFLDQEVEGREGIRFSVMGKEDFLYRRKCKDKFLSSIMDNPDNMVALNRI